MALLAEWPLTGQDGWMERPFCLVTGGTSGLGRATAAILARQGYAVLLTGRNRARGEAVVADLKKTAAASAGPAEFFAADLSTLAGVRALAAEVRRRSERLHVLVNNAGLIGGHERRLTPDGFEETFAVNHLAPFLLTSLLREPLTAAGSARVVTVASEAHRALATLDFDNLQSERRYRPFRAYAQSKLANVLFTRELVRRWEGSGVTANCLHPGVVRTAIWAGGGILGRLIGVLGWPFMISAERGGGFVARLASSPEVAGVTGRYFDKGREATPSPGAQDDAVTVKLWEVSEALISR